ncbi:hypothetical protein V8G54_028078, partial [Vigna mungo]
MDYDFAKGENLIPVDCISMCFKSNNPLNVLGCFGVASNLFILFLSHIRSLEGLDKLFEQFLGDFMSARHVLLCKRSLKALDKLFEQFVGDFMSALHVLLPKRSLEALHKLFEQFLGDFMSALHVLLSK